MKPTSHTVGLSPDCFFCKKTLIHDKLPNEGTSHLKCFADLPT